MPTITYPQNVIWHKEIKPGYLLENFGLRHQKRLRATQTKLSTLNIFHTIQLISNSFLDKFIPLYQDQINTKNNPRPQNIEKTLEKYKGVHSCYGLLLYQDNKLVGGALYIHKNNRITTAFKAFRASWYTKGLQASPTLYAEFLLYEHAIVHGYTLISHGQDRNPYGIYSNIGLCSFKLSLGYNPIITNKTSILEINTETINTTCLILRTPKKYHTVTEADLFIHQNNLQAVESVTQYPTKLFVKIHILEER